MEKIQKLNFRLLVIAGIVALIGTGPMVAFIAFGVIFYFLGADQGLSAYRNMTVQDFLLFPVELIKMIFYDFFIIPGLIFIPALVLFRKKKHALSIFLCVIVLLCTASLLLFQFYKAERNYEEFKMTLSIDSSSCHGSERIESPEVGFLVPTDKFAPNNFKKWNQIVCADPSITTRYEYEETKKITSSITYVEDASVKFSEQIKKTAKNSVVHSFTFEGLPGEVAELKYQETKYSGHVSYLLSWDDHGKLVMIHAENVKKSQITPQTLAAMLKNLERVK